jgi:hypothetical protein
MSDLPIGSVVPSKVKAMGGMYLGGGIFAILLSLAALASTLCVAFWFVYSLVMGILAAIRGAQLLGKNAKGSGNGKAIAIMQIVNIICCDPVNLGLGITCLVFHNDPEVAAYLSSDQSARA